MNERIARLRTHQKNVERYQSLLKTKLNDLEVEFLEKRLSEERLAVAVLQFMGPSGASKRDDDPDPSADNRYVGQGTGSASTQEALEADSGVEQASAKGMAKHFRST
jgi:hypothetical protein